MNALQIFALALYLLGTIVSAKRRNDDDMPADLSDEMYCQGCEATVKALERILGQPSQDSMDVRVVEAVASVCDQKNFENSEYEASSLVTACKYLTGSKGEVMEPLLVSHFSRRPRPSFMDLVQQVCIDLTFACPNTARPTWQDLDSMLEAGPEEWQMHSEQSVRVPRPVKEEL